MSRRIEYDEVQFLKESTVLFLKKGYGATSMRDILSNTGMNRHSLYKNYGDKHGLYREILNFYKVHFFSDIYNLLEKNPKGLTSLKTFFKNILSTSDPIKCVMVRTIADKGLLEDDLYKISELHFNRIRRGIYSNLKISQKEKKISSNEDLQSLTNLLLGTFQGLPVSTNMLGNKKMLKAISYLLDRAEN